MQGVPSRCRSFRSARAFVIVLTGLAAFGMAGIGAVDRAVAQTPPPVTLSGVFTADQSAITPAGLAALKATAEKFKAEVKAQGCYPLRLTFTMLLRGVDWKDESPEGIANQIVHRNGWNALKAFVASLGLGVDQSVELGDAGTDDGDVSVTNGAFRKGDDKDPPRLKVTSNPPKGTKVKAGDKIEVTITASERYKDGHKSWPTGVQMIQLLADDGLVDSKQYGRPPQPCARQTFAVTYTVPKNPPAIVHLHALAEDGVGHQSGDDAEFPTGDVWKGTLHMSGEGNVYKDEADMNLTFVVDRDGKISGNGRATVTPYPRVFVESDNCTYAHTVNPSTFDVAVEGQRQVDEFQLKIRSLTTATAQVSVTGGGAYCHVGSGPPVAAPDPFGATSVPAIIFRVPAKDRAVRAGRENIHNVFKVEWRLKVEAAQR